MKKKAAGAAAAPYPPVSSFSSAWRKYLPATLHPPHHQKSILIVLLLCFTSWSPHYSSVVVQSQEESTAFQFPRVPPPPPPSNTSVMRAWTCHGRNQMDMVDRLRQAGIIRHDAVQNVMNRVDRVNYVPNTSPAYQDTPISIGLGQTISAPHMHAHVLEEILPHVVPKPTNAAGEPVKFLDVGCGSGYLTACLGRWVHPLIATGDSTEEAGSGAGSTILGRTGQVFGIDIFPHLVQMTKNNMSKQDSDLIQSQTVVLQVANGWEGLPEQAPFDAIHVGAAAAEFPQTLAQQLKLHGVLIVPIGPQQGAQALYKIERIAVSDSSSSFDPKEYRFTELLGVRYVPLIEQPSRS